MITKLNLQKHILPILPICSYSGKAIFFCLILASAFCPKLLQSQDLHFSQFNHAMQNINPALVGVMKPDYRISSVYRSQWQSVPVPYLTFMGSFEMKYYLPGHEEGFFAGGLLFNYDQAGDARYRLTQLGLSLNYSRVLNDNYILTGGFQYGRGQRALDISQLRFANQYDGEKFDPNRSTRENDLSGNGFSYSDFSAGINVHIKSDRGRLGSSSGNVGIGVFHLNRPALDFYNSQSSRLPFRFTIYSNGWLNFPNLDRMDFYLAAFGQLMGVYNEGIVGGDVRYFLSEEKEKKIAVSLGLYYRFVGINDALVPMVKFYYQDWTVGLSFDVNLSELRVATRGRGGPEISAIYSITKVKPLKEFRACPLF